MAEEAIALAERTDALVDHGDACLALATVLGAAGNTAEARAAAEQALELYDRKGAAALAEKARRLLVIERPAPPAEPEAPAIELENTCVRVIRQSDAAVARGALDEPDRFYAHDVSVESRRKVVGFTPGDFRPGEWPQIARHLREGWDWHRSPVIAVRGERLALTRIELGTDDASPGAPHEEFLALWGLDKDGRIALQVFFDVEDLDTAIAELDARHRAIDQEHTQVSKVNTDHACIRAVERLAAAIDREAWDEVEQGFALTTSVESRRRVVGFPRIDLASHKWRGEIRRYLRDMPVGDYAVTATRGDRLALLRLQTRAEDPSPGAPQDEVLLQISLDAEGRITHQVWFDVEDLDAAIAELDSRFAELEKQRSRLPLENAASRVEDQCYALFAEGRIDDIAALLSLDHFNEDRRQGLRRVTDDRAAAIGNIRAIATLGANITHTPIALRGDRLCLSRVLLEQPQSAPEGFSAVTLELSEINNDGLAAARVVFDFDDLDAAIAELDARYLAGEAAAHTQTWSKVAEAYARLNRRELPATTREWINIDHRRLAPVESGHLAAFVRDAQDLWGVIYIEKVHRLSDTGAVVSRAIDATSHDGFNAEWREIDLLTFEGTRISRLELFDEADIYAAIAKFDELSRPAPQLENAASRLTDRYLSLFVERDWDTLAGILADNFTAVDRRRVVNAETRQGRDADIAALRATADLGLKTYTCDVLATRGDRLALSRVRILGDAEEPEASRIEFLAVGEINTEGHALARIIFDPDDLDGAFTELDSRYLAGEAASYAHTWSVIAGTYAAFNRNDPADVVNIDHRKAVRYAPGELTTAMYQEVALNLRSHVEAVHQLNGFGAVVTGISYGTSPEGFQAAWRQVQLLIVDGDRMVRNEMFDEADLDSALAKLDSISRPARNLDNTANRVVESYLSHFAARDWHLMTPLLADEFSADDRRRVVNSGLRHGRENEIANLKAMAEVGCADITTKPVAVRGERLVLAHHTFVAPNWPELDIETVDVVEIDADNKIVAEIGFDATDLDAALAELDARYLAGEAAAHADTWSVIAAANDALNRRETPSTDADMINIDHRRIVAIGDADPVASVDGIWAVAEQFEIYIEAVHRLSDLGAVVTHAAHGTSPEGFNAEWRGVNVLTVADGLITRCELFDEADIAYALERFDKLCRPMVRLENDATRVSDRVQVLFEARNWAALGELHAEEVSTEDRRRVVRGAARTGRDAEVANLRAMADLGAPAIGADVLALRGRRLALYRSRVSDNVSVEVSFLTVLEINNDHQIWRVVVFDPDDIDVALAVIDARYLAGEAARYAETWSLVMRAYTEANNKNQLMLSPDAVTVDHRRGRAFSPGEMAEYMYATWDLAPDVSAYIEVVHRLSHFGTVVTHVARGASQQGFEAEWREVILATVDGDLINRCEMFDEADLDAALARLDELSRPAPQLKNDAVRVGDRCQVLFEARDWSALAELYAEDVTADDRRHGISGGARSGRDVEVTNLQAMVELWAPRIDATVFATRGGRLVLFHHHVTNHDELVEMSYLVVFEINVDGLIVGVVAFDEDDLDAAYAELDARYIAGEAATNAHVWSVVLGAYTAVNRHELPPWTADAVSIDHRSAAFIAPGDLAPYVHAMWSQTPDVRVDIVAVHRLTSVGALVTHVATGTTEHGFEGEWREITLSIVEGDRISRSEMFDEADLDAALARFDEFDRPDQRIENAASRIYDRVQEYNAERDWDAVASLMAEDLLVDDRRPMMGAGIRHGRDAAISDMRTTAELGLTHVTSVVLAIRGERLLLIRSHHFRSGDESDDFVNEVICLYELNADDQVAVGIIFNPDEIDAAIEELETRYLAGEAAAYAHTWSVIARNVAAFNRGEQSTTTPDWITIDHRRVARFAPEELSAAVRDFADSTPEFRARNVTVHRLGDRGAVVTTVSHGTSPQGFEAEWRVIQLLTIDGDFISRCELFDEADLDAAMARFEELGRAARRLENAATRVIERFTAHFAAQNWNAVADILAEDVCDDDRRRVVNSAIQRGRDAQLANLRVLADVGVGSFAPIVIATRGDRLALTRAKVTADGHPSDTFVLEMLTIGEINADGQLAASIHFDDVAAAFAELDARYLAGEAAPHAHVYSVIAESFAAVNQRELPSTAADFVGIDHRRPVAFSTLR